MHVRFFVILALGLATGATAQEARPAASDLPHWNMEVLSKPPRTYPASAPSAKDMTAVFYDGLPWKQRPTRVFAYYGVPKVAAGTKVPGMVLVHGGGGTAFESWVRLWNGRGYAAIAMDTCGCVPIGEYGKWQRHDDGGPPGWGGFDQIDVPAQDQWTYHAIADVVLAHSLLRSLPGVDADRIGLTGISWGGYLTCIASGVDARFPLRRAGVRLRLPGRELGLAPRVSENGDRESDPLALLVGPFGLAAPDPDADALGHGHE